MRFNSPASFALLSLALLGFTAGQKDDGTLDSFIYEPKNFKAFSIGQLGGCSTQIVFQIDRKDGTYNYQTYGRDGNQTFLLPPQIPFGGNQPISVIDPTPGGAKWAYLLLLNSGEDPTMDGYYQLLPYQVNRCTNNRKLTTFFVTATDSKTSKTVLTSRDFTLTNDLVPLSAPANIVAKSKRSTPRTFAVSWSYSTQQAIQGYFIIAGAETDKTLASTYVKGANATSGTVTLFDQTDPAKAVFTVSAYGKNGAVTSPTNCLEVGGTT